MNKKIALIRIFASTLFLVTSLLVIHSCNNEDVAPATTSKEIDQTGGVLSGKDGVINLNIPEGALDANTKVSITESTETSPTNGVGKIYTLTPEGTTFTKPISLSFQYADKDVLSIPPSSLAIAFKKSDNTWQVMPTLEVDETTNTITTETTHFSQWTLLEIPTISSFKPTSGIVGTSVTITGFNFSKVKGENKVMLNGKQATVLSSSTTEIVFQVPVGAATGKVIVQTQFDTFDYTVNSDSDFTFETGEPQIISFSPANGAVGTIVTITGKLFSAVIADNKVLMNGIQAVVTSSTTNQIVFVVPAGAKTGSIIIQTLFNQLNYTAQSPTSFIVDTNEPVITSFAPSSGPVGTVVTITGKNFSSVASDNKVMMNGLLITPISSSTTQVVFTVQAGATTAKIIVQTQFTGLDYIVNSPSDFVVN